MAKRGRARAARASGAPRSHHEQPFGRRATAVSLVIIAAVMLVFFGRTLVFREVLTGGDVLAAAVIFEQYADESLAAGHLPLWNPYVFSGMPFFDSMSWNAVVYPTYWIKTALEAIPGVDLPRLTFLALHYLLAGFGMFFFLRSRGVGHAGATTGGIAFMITPHLVGLAAIGHGGKVLAASYIPLVLMAAQRLMETGARRWVAILALLGGLQFLARHVQVSYYTWLIVAVYVVCDALFGGRERAAWPAFAKRAGMLLGAGVLAALLGAVLLLPLREYADFSTRTAAAGGMGFEQATMWSFHPKEIITFLVPSFFGLADDTYWGTMPFQQVSHYMGYVVLLLAAVAVVRKRGRDVAFLTVLFALGIVLAFGKHFGPLYRLVYETLPGFDRFRVPALFLLMAQFAAAALAGHGASVVLGEGDRGRGPWTKWVVAGAGVGIVVGLVVLLSRSAIADSASIALMAKHKGVEAAVLRSVGDRAAAMAVRDAGILVAMAAAAGVAVLAAGSRRLPALLPALLLIGVATWDLGIVDKRFLHPTRMEPLATYYPETPAVRFLKGQPGPFRVAPLGSDFSSNAYMYHRLESIGGYHPAKLAVYDALLSKAGLGNLKLLAMLNVRYVVGIEQIDHPAFRAVAPGVYEFLGALPRAFLASEAKVTSSPELALAEFGVDNFDPSRTAVLLEPLPGPIESPAGGTVELTAWGPERLEARVSAPRPCLLVLSEIYYEPGWKAFVDGTETKIYRTDYAFRSVYLGAGTHTVVLSHSAGTLRLGLVLSICAAAAIVLLWALPQASGRRRP